MNELASIGHNNPPDPIDEAIAPFEGAIVEAENWLDGVEVENISQMEAVDAIIKDVRAAKTSLAKAKKLATSPLHDAWKAEIARWKPTEDDIERRLDGLKGLVSGFKKKLEQERQEALRAAREEEKRLEEVARAASAQASVADFSAQVAAAEAKQAAGEAKQAASAAAKDTVKGLRTVTKYEVTDHAAYWANAISADEKRAFIEEHARKNHKVVAPVAGLRVWTEKEAY